MNTITPEMGTLKTRLKAMWMSGDYAEFAKPMEPGALEFLRRLGLPRGTKLLDVGCGAGQTAIPAARAGARVTAVDIATNWVEHTRSRARNEGLDVQVEEGDAEELAQPNDAFDVVLSMFAAMFAPRPEHVAAELVRVCRPGGRIVMANWTPQGFVGQMFAIIGRYVPPPAMPSPLLWGVEDTLRERFAGRVSSLEITRRLYPFEYPFGPARVADFFRAHYGPTHRAFAALDAARQNEMRDELVSMWSKLNLADDSTTRFDGEYLELIAVRA